jgi:hypothetical protein
VPDKRTHRGAHPEDKQQFAPSTWLSLQLALRDLCWLLSHGYAEKSSLKIVGDRYALTQRQRMAVMRSGCSEQARQRRFEHQVNAATLRNKNLLLDGYNILTTVEAALAGGIILWGRDGTFRDLAGMHGTYRKVKETEPALELIADFIHQLGVHNCLWYLDSPVSNSGRLKTIIRQLAAVKNWNWQVELVFNPDRILSESQEIVVSSDSEILNHCRRWYNLAEELIRARIPDAQIIDLSYLPEPE